jgi:hypothetical protein
MGSATVNNSKDDTKKLLLQLLAKGNPMPQDSPITREDLETHCGHIHGPIADNLKELKTWNRSLVILLITILLTAFVNMFVNLSTKNAVNHESQRAIRYEAAQPTAQARTVGKAVQ